MAVGAYALTSNAKLQSFVDSVYVAAEETLWNMLIDIATGIIERNTYRLLKSREYAREIYNGTGGSRLYLKQWPVSQVRRVSVGRTSVFSIKNTTAKTRAEVEVTASAILLRADGATSPTEIKFADFATINLLVAKIETYAGWDCGLLVSDYGVLSSTECLRRPAMACKDPDLAYVEAPDEDMTDYYLENPDEDRNAGMLFSPSGFESGVQNILVDYTAGFATIPNDLEGACLILTKLLYDQVKKDLAVQSETLGDYAYTIAAGAAEASIGVPAIIAPVIGYYRRLLSIP